MLQNNSVYFDLSTMAQGSSANDLKQRILVAIALRRL